MKNFCIYVTLHYLCGVLDIRFLIFSAIYLWMKKKEKLIEKCGG
jgi:hypothetical protein